MEHTFNFLNGALAGTIAILIIICLGLHGSNKRYRNQADRLVKKLFGTENELQELRQNTIYFHKLVQAIDSPALIMNTSNKQWELKSPQNLSDDQQRTIIYLCQRMHQLLVERKILLLPTSAKMLDDVLDLLQDISVPATRQYWDDYNPHDSPSFEAYKQVRAIIMEALRSAENKTQRDEIVRRVNETLVDANDDVQAILEKVVTHQ